MEINSLPEEVSHKPGAGTRRPKASRGTRGHPGPPVPPSDLRVPGLPWCRPPWTVSCATPNPGSWHHRRGVAPCSRSMTPTPQRACGPAAPWPRPLEALPCAHTGRKWHPGPGLSLLCIFTLFRVTLPSRPRGLALSGGGGSTQTSQCFAAVQREAPPALLSAPRGHLGPLRSSGLPRHRGCAVCGGNTCWGPRSSCDSGGPSTAHGFHGKDAL